MLKTRLFVFTFLLTSSALLAQPAITRDTVSFYFWNSTYWPYSSVVEQIRNPVDDRLMSARKYYANNLLAEEYLRVDDSTWFYQQIDSIDPTRLICRGLYAVDPEFELMDTTSYFDPVTYEEGIHLRYSRALYKTGPWVERDHNGYVWTGSYDDDLREGLWKKRDAYDFTELRGYVYDGGELVHDTILNWALSDDTARINGLLCEGVVPGQRGGLVSENTPGGLWRLCSVNPDALGKNKIWQFTHYDFLPGQCSNESWGSYLFLENRTLLYGVPAEYGLSRDEGRWELLDGNKLLLSLKKQGEHRFQMKFLADGVLILQELTY